MIINSVKGFNVGEFRKAGRQVKILFLDAIDIITEPYACQNHSNNNGNNVSKSINASNISLYIYIKKIQRICIASFVENLFKN